MKSDRKVTFSPIPLKEEIFKKLQNNPVDTSRLRNSGPIEVPRTRAEGTPSSMIPLDHELTRGQKVAAIAADKHVRRTLHLEPEKNTPRVTPAYPPLPDKPRVWHNPGRNVDPDYEIGLLRQEIDERIQTLMTKDPKKLWHDARKEATQHFYQNRLHLYPELVETAGRSNLLPEYRVWRKISNFLQDEFNTALNTALLRNMTDALGHLEGTCGMPSSRMLVSREDAETMKTQRGLFRPKPKEDIGR